MTFQTRQGGTTASSRLVCWYHPGYYYELPPEHPFPMEKFRQAHDLLLESCPQALEVRPAPLAGWEDVIRVHPPSYLEKIERNELLREEALRLGLPVRPALLERCRRETGGTIAAAKTALEEGVAVNLAGGTHHAMAERGLGYCVLNDVVVAIRALREEYPGLRVAVVDTDAHQGNGTHALLHGDGYSATYSIHVGRNYPSEKVAGTMDVALPRWVEGEIYGRILGESLPKFLKAHPCDLIFWIAGADLHQADRFGQMCLDDEDMERRDRRVISLLLEEEVPFCALFGGGYNRVRDHTGFLHAATVRRLAEILFPVRDKR